MVFGRFGNQFGNIVFGYGAQVSQLTAFGGVTASQIGPVYDCAIGFDNGTGSAVMVGYVVAEGKQWSEATQLQQNQQLISQASPNLIDRDLTYWPKVSQGDWSGGERQVTFGVNNVVNRYYQTDGGIEASVPANLTMTPSLTSTLTNADAGNGVSPLACDGTNFYLGVTGTNLFIGNGLTNTGYHIPAASTHEIYDILATPYGIFVGSQDGIFNVTPSGSYTQWTNDPIGPVPGRSMAYFNEAIWYITNSDQRVSYVNAAGGAVAGTTYKTQGAVGTVLEPHLSCIASTSNGLFFSTWREASASNAAAISVLYTSDGSSNIPGSGFNRIGDVYGQVVYAHEMNGILYILTYGAQVAGGSYDYTLYAFQNGSLSELDDLRYVTADFRALAPGVATIAKAQISGDGRFLYIAWPGLQTVRYDTVLQAWQKVGTPKAYGSAVATAHRVVTSQTIGLLDVLTANGSSSLYQYDTLPPAAGTTGTLVTAYVDFSTPGLTKFLRTFEVRFTVPLPSGASVTARYQLDSASAWTSMAAQATNPNLQTCFFPAGVKAQRVRFQLVFTAGAGGAPQVQSIQVKGNLGRVWKTTFTCKREQLTRNGSVDSQGLKAKDLIANLYNAYRNATNVTAYVPSPSAVSGVEQVTAALETYTWTSVKGSPDPGDMGTYDLEGDVDIVLIEN